MESEFLPGTLFYDSIAENIQALEQDIVPELRQSDVSSMKTLFSLSSRPTFVRALEQQPEFPEVKRRAESLLRHLASTTSNSSDDVSDILPVNLLPPYKNEEKKEHSETLPLSRPNEDSLSDHQWKRKYEDLAKEKKELEEKYNQLRKDQPDIPVSMDDMEDPVPSMDDNPWYSLRNESDFVKTGLKGGNIGSPGDGTKNSLTFATSMISSICVLIVVAGAIVFPASKALAKKLILGGFEAIRSFLNLTVRS